MQSSARWVSDSAGSLLPAGPAGQAIPPGGSLVLADVAALARLRRGLRLGLNCLVLGADRSRGGVLVRLAAEAGRHAPVAVVSAREAATASEVLGRVGSALQPGEPKAADPAAGDPDAGDPAAGDPTAGEPARDALARLARLASGRRRTVVVLPDLPSRLVRPVFGQLRDELWQVPLQWVVGGSAGERRDVLAAPADAFFEIVVTVS